MLIVDSLQQQQRLSRKPCTHNRWLLRNSLEQRRPSPLAWLFLVTYVFSCVLFWWLQSILLKFWLGLDSPIEAKFLWISIAALVLFAIGYLIPVPRISSLGSSQEVLDRCEVFSYRAVVFLAIPAFAVAIQFSAYRFTVNYNEGHGISLFQQAVLYTHLFFGLLYIGCAKDALVEKRKLLWVVVLTIAPRLLISLRWGRFFAAQAIVPILFIAIARGWTTVSFKRLVQIALIGAFILIVPAMTRGDTMFGEDEQGRPQIVDYFGYMNTMGFFQDNTDITYPCQPLLVSLTAKLIPYSALGMCTTDVGEDKNLPATLDRLLTKQYSDDLMAGTGGNYLLELYLLGGITAIMIGSAIFGFTCHWFVQLLSHRSLYAGIWAECLSRALFAPRGNLGYVYERIPSLVLATLAVVAFSWALGKIGESRVVAVRASQG